MKIKQLTYLTLFLISFCTFAQDGKFLREKKEQIKALKVAYITDELSLTTSEAEKFWPLYNAFEDRQREIRKQKLKGYLERIEDEDFDKLSEKDAAAVLDQLESTEDELHTLRKKFVASLKNVLPATKILKLKKAEDGFKRKLLQQYRNRKLGR